MKTNLRVFLVVDFDEAIPATEFDNFLKSKLEEKGIDLVLPFGHGDCIVIIKDKISDKQEKK